MEHEDAAARFGTEIQTKGRPRGSYARPVNITPALRQFVHSLSLLGVPVKEICKQVAIKEGLPKYYMRELYRDFRADLLARGKRGKAGKKPRVRVAEKPFGWAPVRRGALLSYSDVLAILNSDLSENDLADLYGVRPSLVRGIRTGESFYVKYVLPKILLRRDRTTTEELRFRAQVTCDLCVKLTQQMAAMVDNLYLELQQPAATPLEVVIDASRVEDLAQHVALPRFEHDDKPVKPQTIAGNLATGEEFK